MKYENVICDQDLGPGKVRDALEMLELFIEGLEMKGNGKRQNCIFVYTGENFWPVFRSFS